MSWASAVGSLFSSASSYAATIKAQREAIKFQREYSQNAHQWEVEDLKKAGLNPILSAVGSGAPSTSAPYSSFNFENPLSEWSATKLAKKQAQAEIDSKDATTSNTEATTELIKTQTGLERDIYQYKVKEAEWNAKTAEQNYLNAKEMPEVYRSQINNNNSAARRNVVDSRRGELELPLYQSAGEAVNSSKSWLEEKWENYKNFKKLQKDFKDSKTNKKSAREYLDSFGGIYD